MHIFPPFFPKSKYLSKKWWHNLIWLLSAIFSLSSLLSIFSTLILLISQMITTFPEKFLMLITVPMAVSLYPLSFFFVRGTPLQTHQSSSYSSTISTISGVSSLSPFYHAGFIILMGYFLFMIFAPSLLYRLILDSTLGKKWKK